MSNNNKLEIMRHSAAHVLAAAVKKLYPNVNFGIGPAIEDGFYYDFDFGKQKVNEDNLPKIEKEMQRIIKQSLPFEKKEISVNEAKKLFKNQPYKLELIDELKEASVSDSNHGKTRSDLLKIYQTGCFIDLCRGPHVKDTSEIGAFKLTSLAGAYWRGDEKNPMLTRIYGVTFSTKKELDEYLKLLEEAKKRDHRKIGKDLDLFSQNEMVGTGLILWHPNLSTVREEIELYWRREHRRRGYQYVYTPHIGKEILWQTSGHTSFYKELMYPPLKDERDDVYYVKPMNCPFHMLIYNARPRSYRELPLKWGELGTVYRYELEGVRHGILRPRGFTQDDAHIICTKEQVVSELEGVLDFAIEINRVFGFEKIHYELSVRGEEKEKKYIGQEETWKSAEETLKEILNRQQIDYNVGIGEAKFYGPAIDLKVEDAMGRKWQGTTIQFDFNLPQKFNMKYIGEDGKEHEPYMIHRTVLGSMERFIGTLIEHYSGAFPVWLSPIQVVVIPISDKQISYAQKIKERLYQIENLSGPLRVEIDERPETLPKKIRDAQIQKIPYMLIVGNKEMKNETVSIRLRTEEDLGEIRLENFLERIQKKINNKALDL